MKSTLALLALLAVFPVRAGYLYWMVGNQVGEVSISGDDYAYLYANGTQVGTDRYYYKSKLNGIYAATDLSSIVGLTEETKFSVSIFHYNDEVAFYSSGAVAYGLLSQYIRGDMAAATSASGTVYWNAIPEPVGGVLVLVGLAVLGLRRRVERAS